MNVIAPMPPLRLIKRLKMYVQATFVFFCATSVVQIFFFINTNFMIVTYSSYCTYYIVLNIHFKKLINNFFLFDIDENYAIAKVKRKYPCKSL